jgi:hypothetical protein
MHKRKPLAYRTAIDKQVRRGFRGYPVATIAYYGPNDQRATKVVVAIILAEGAEPSHLQRWYADGDVRKDRGVVEQIMQFIRQRDARTVVAAPRIIGCPHEEGVDYPEGEHCPECPFWVGRNRFTGELLD